MQAIHTVGFEKIRNLTVALLLLENAESSGSGNLAPSVAALALASGLMAQTMVEKTGTGDPDQAFVCTALRNYGRLLLANFIPDRYRQAQELAVKAGWDAACRQVFGLTAASCVS